MSNGIIKGVNPILVVDAPCGKLKGKKLGSYLDKLTSQVKIDTGGQYYIIVRESERTRGAINFNVL